MCGRLLVSLAPLQRWPIALSAPAEALMKMAKWRLVTPSLQNSPKLSPAIMFPSKGSFFFFFLENPYYSALCLWGISANVWIRWLHPSGLAADILSRVFQRDGDREEKKTTHTIMAVICERSLNRKCSFFRPPRSSSPINGEAVKALGKTLQQAEHSHQRCLDSYLPWRVIK